jgi:LuxR family maltose regulon positive regulatory protein
MVYPMQVVEETESAALDFARRGLLITKLNNPRVRPNLLSRPRLIESINSGLERKLTLISTPPGYGKSSLAVQWRSQAERPTAWLSVDETDSEPFSFFGYVVAALRTMDASLFLRTQSLIDRSSTVHPRTLTT